MADMTHGENYHGPEAEKHDLLFINCPACKKFTATPVEKEMAKLIRLYEEWRVLEESLPPKWHTAYWCDECQTSQTIHETNLVMVNDEVKIKCPLCRSLISSMGIVPSGIRNEILKKPAK